MAGKKKKKQDDHDPNSRTVCRNRKARREYEIVETMECGIALLGSEVKSIRDSRISIDEAYARVIAGEVWLINSDVAEYPQATVMNHDPKRRRKLLLHKREVRKFAEGADQKGLTLIPLSVYFTRGKVKVKLAVARGRKLHDKREKIRRKADRQEMAVARRTSQG